MSDTGSTSSSSRTPRSASSAITSPTASSTGDNSSPTLSSSWSMPPLQTPTNSPNDNGNGNGFSSPTASATLYLYTFLATLVLLLGVSSAIVVRSLVLRRRHRAMVEEAIRNGTWIPPVSGRSARIDPANKPKMHEVYLGGGTVKGGQVLGGGSTGLYGVGGGDLGWAGIMPLYANYVGGGGSSVSSAPSAMAQASTQDPSRRIAARVLGMLGRPRRSPSAPISQLASTPTHLPPSSAPPPPSSAPPPPPPPPAAPPSTAPDKLCLAFLIAMPSQTPLPSQRHPSTSHAHVEEEEELPEVQMGVAEVPIVMRRTSEESEMDCHGGDRGEGMSKGYDVVSDGH